MGIKLNFAFEVDESLNVSSDDFINEYLDGDMLFFSDEDSGVPKNIWIYNNNINDDKLNKMQIDSNFDDLSDSVLRLSEINIPEKIKEFKKLKDVDKFLKLFENIFGENKIKVLYLAMPSY